MPSLFMTPEYQAFVKNCFIPEADPNYNLLRAGLEFAEEYLEFCNAKSSAQKLDEAGDVLFWLALIGDFVYADFDTKFTCQTASLGECVQKMLGSVKRYYRDKNASKLFDLAFLVNECYQHLNAVPCLNGKLNELAEANMAKLTRRINNNTIQGEGNR